MPRVHGDSIRFLWIIEFEYAPRLHHGAFLRYFNFSPELIAQGHSVTFAVRFLDADPGPARQYFTELVARRVISDFVEVAYTVPMWRRRVAARVVYPGLTNWLFRGAQKVYADLIDRLVEERQIDLVIISDGNFFFLPRRLRCACSFIYDCVDSRSLQASRQLQAAWRRGALLSFIRVLRRAIDDFAFERYYARQPLMKITVSPVDKHSIDQQSGAPESCVVILNGVRGGVSFDRLPKTPGRLIFSGNMDFPPNVDAAVWFLDNVFPLLLRERPDACFVIAGANPVPVLRAREAANVVVTGFVEDLNVEIARSEVYVAPMISGGGFKNKVVEAIVNHTFVVGTPMAFEFLPADLRELMAVAGSASEMVSQILEAMRDPQRAAAQAELAYRLVNARFGWPGRAKELAALAQSVLIQARNRPS